MNKELCVKANRQSNSPDLLCSFMMQNKTPLKICPYVWYCSQTMKLYNSDSAKKCPILELPELKKNQIEVLSRITGMPKGEAEGHCVKKVAPGRGGVGYSPCPAGHPPQNEGDKGEHPQSFGTAPSVEGAEM